MTYMHAPSATRNRTMPAHPETPLQRIEGEAFAISVTAMAYCGDASERDAADSLHDRALTLAKHRAIEIGARDIVALIETAELHDAAEDAAYRRGDGRVETIHDHSKAIAGTVEMTEATWDRLADLLTVATFRAMRDGSAAYTTMQEILALVRTQTSHSSTRIDGLRVANATTEQLVASTDRLLDQMRSLVMEQATCGATHPRAAEMASEGVRLLQCDQGAEYHAVHVFEAAAADEGTGS